MKQLSPGAMTAKRFFRNKLAVAGLAILGIMLPLFIKKLPLLNRLITVALTVTVLLCGGKCNRVTKDLTV